MKLKLKKKKKKIKLRQLPISSDHRFPIRILNSYRHAHVPMWFFSAVGAHVEDEYLPACAVCGRSCGCWPVWTSGSSAENLQESQTSANISHPPTY